MCCVNLCLIRVPSPGSTIFIKSRYFTASCITMISNFLNCIVCAWLKQLQGEANVPYEAHWGICLYPGHRLRLTLLRSGHIPYLIWFWFQKRFTSPGPVRVVTAVSIIASSWCRSRDCQEVLLARTAGSVTSVVIIGGVQDVHLVSDVTQVEDTSLVAVHVLTSVVIIVVYTGVVFRSALALVRRWTLKMYIGTCVFILLAYLDFFKDSALYLLKYVAFECLFPL